MCMFVEESFPDYRPSSKFLQQHLFSLLQNRCKTIKHLSQIHAQITTNGFNHKSFILVKLLSLYTAFSNFPAAHQVFDQLPNPSSPLCNQIIRAYSVSGNPRKSVELINTMCRSLTLPDAYSYNFVLNACAKGGLVGEGEQIHGRVLKSGFFSNIYILTSLIDFYVKCGGGGDGIGKAKKVFDEMPERNVVTWNSLLLGSFRCGDVDGARRIFEEMPERSVVSWTTMISGCVDNGRYKEALAVFREMREENIELDQVALLAVLGGCAERGDLDMGKWIHSYVYETFVSRRRPICTELNNALIHMYASCGDVEAAFSVFRRMKQRTIVSWTSVIIGFAKRGLGDEAISVFQQMEQENVKPDGITLLGVLCACSHSGNVNEGRRYFKTMIEKWGIEPKIKHFGCMVDLLSRAGFLDEAHKLVKTMPMKPNDAIWGALLGGCRIHKRVEIAAEVADWLTEEVNQHRGAGYLVLLSNVYASAKRWEDVVSVRKKMLGLKMKKPPGRSWIQIEGTVYEFMAGDRSHEKAGFIYDVVDVITREARFQDDSEWVGLSSIVNPPGDSTNRFDSREGFAKLVS